MVGIYFKCLASYCCVYAEVALYQYTKIKTRSLVGVQYLSFYFQVEVLYSKGL